MIGVSDSMFERYPLLNGNQHGMIAHDAYTVILFPKPVFACSYRSGRVLYGQHPTPLQPWHPAIVLPCDLQIFLHDATIILVYVDEWRKVKKGAS